MELTAWERWRGLFGYVVMIGLGLAGIFSIFDALRAETGLRSALFENGGRILISTGLLLFTQILRIFIRRDAGHTIRKAAYTFTFGLMFLLVFLVLFYALELLIGYQLQGGPYEDWFLLVPLGVTLLLTLGLVTVLRNGFPSFLKPRKKKEVPVKPTTADKEPSKLQRISDKVTDDLTDKRLGIWGQWRFSGIMLQGLGMMVLGIAAVIVSLLAGEKVWNAVIIGLPFAGFGFVLLNSKDYLKKRTIELETNPRKRREEYFWMYLLIVLGTIPLSMVFLVIYDIHESDSAFTLMNILSHAGTWIGLVFFCLFVIVMMAVYGQPMIAAIKEKSDQMQPEKKRKIGFLVLVMVLAAALAITAIILVQPLIPQWEKDLFIKRLKPAPYDTAACYSWDEIDESFRGRDICVTGILTQVVYKEESERSDLHFSEDGRGFLLIDRERFVPDLSGMCVTARGEVLMPINTPYMLVDEENLFQCP